MSECASLSKFYSIIKQQFELPQVRERAEAEQKRRRDEMDRRREALQERRSQLQVCGANMLKILTV